MRTALLLAVVAVGAADPVLAQGKATPPDFTPKIMLGVVVGEGLLSYQDRGTEGRVRWYWGEPKGERVLPLGAILPHEWTQRVEGDYGGRYPSERPSGWCVAFGSYWSIHSPVGSSSLPVPPIYEAGFPPAADSEGARRGPPFPGPDSPALPLARLTVLAIAADIERSLPRQSRTETFSSEETLPKERSWFRLWRNEFVGRLANYAAWAENRETSGNRAGSRVRFHADIMPISREGKIALLALADDQMTLWDIDYEAATRPDGVAYRKGEWRLKAAFPTPLRERFRVAVADGAFLFVTDSGAVHMAEEIKGEWKTRAVWKDEKRPIIAMLGDSDSPGGFVFGKDFYFRLGRDAKPKPCEDVTQGRPDLAEPLRTVFQCGRVLYKNGELKKAETAKSP